MRRALALLSLTLLCAAPRPAVASEAATLEPAQAPLQLSELLATIEQSYPLFLSARLDRDVAEGELRTARGGFDPVWKTRAQLTPFGYYEYQRLDTFLEVPTPLYGATFYGGYRLGLGKIPDYDGKQETLSGGELRAGLNLPILRDGYIDRRRVTLERARLGLEVAGLSVAQARLELRRVATQRYWDWVAAGRRLAVAEDLLEIAKARDAVLAARIGHGDLPPVEQTENARAIAQREAQVAASQRGLEQSAIELSLFLRDSAGQPMLPSGARLPPGLPEPQPSPRLDDDLPVALLQRPEPRRLSLLRTQSDLEVRLARNQLLPALDVSFFLSKDLGRGSQTLVPVAGEIGLLLDVPLLFRQGRGRLDASRALLRRAEQQLRFARDRVTADVRDASSAIVGSHARIDAARTEVRLAHELERLERQRFELGDSTLFFVNLREQAAVEAALREIDALADYHKARAAYEAAVAR